MDTSSNSSIEKCQCEKSQESDSSNSDSSSSTTLTATTTTKKLKISLTSLGLNLRRGRSKRNNNNKKPSLLVCNNNVDGAASTSKDPLTKKSWSIKFNCTKKEPKVTFPTEPTTTTTNCCKCTCYNNNNKKTNDDQEQQQEVDLMSGLSETAAVASSSSQLDSQLIKDENNGSIFESDLSDDFCHNEFILRDNQELLSSSHHSLLNNDNLDDGDGVIRGIYGISRNSSCLCIGPWDMHWIRTIHEDCDEAARLARAREIEQGVEAPANFRSVRQVQLLCEDADGGQMPRRLQLVYPTDLTVDSLRALFQNHVTLHSCPLDNTALCHTQVDFIHCLVPDLLDITKCSFYWGKMDRYEAERLLDGKPEGTFLLRDSAQEEFLFSVSFRKYGRSLHARIEQWNHKFSFDSHDPGVYTSHTVCGLIEHYKDPSSCMFFEPMLTWPLHRNFTFSLQHLSRATIVNRLTYDNVNQLQLPKTLKSYLKEYHYRQKVRVKRFDDDIQWLDLRNCTP